MLKTILSRKNESASNLQVEARQDACRRNFRHPEARPIIAANRVYKRRYSI